MPVDLPPAAPPSAVTRHTVLLVDDEESILNALKRLLRKEGLQIVIATSAAEGLEILARQPIHLVITDQRMPGMEGTEFLRKVKERWPQTVRVVLTGYADPALVVESINEGGVFRFFGKPWDDEELRTGIRQCIAQYDLQEENRRLMEQVKEQNERLRQMNAELEDMVEARTSTLLLAQEVLEKLPAAIFCLSDAGDLVLTNAMANRLFAPDGVLMPGTPAEEVLPPSLIEAVLQSRQNATAIRHPDLLYADRTFSVYTAPVGRSGERGILLSMRDITDE